MKSRFLLAALLATVLACIEASAAELVSLATMAVTGALDPLATQFTQQTGHMIKISYDTGPNLARRIAAGETGDVLIAPQAVVAQAVKDGRVGAASVVALGQVGVGVAVRKGATIPALSSADALKQALRNADAVYYSQGTSGTYVATLFESLGIAAEIKGKTRQLANGGAMLEELVKDRRNAIGFTMISEIRLMEPQGVALVGPLPAAIQNYTTFSAAVMTTSGDATAARAFLAFITTPAAKARFVATGWQ